ncbi:MAG: tRNA glutamyl-Q(34) synthetase GluQRS [Alphaproteobacteria bacterium]|nr:tRNA glutamyl-Q(34) synthetase GluQRS [Alphaproteobacteria bacterium]
MSVTTKIQKMPGTDIITRFAPSPTGYLHLGHIFSALEARRFADAYGGEMRLRIEDIDHTRCRDEYRSAIFEDLDFMGITIDGPVITQSERLANYRQALFELEKRELIYPCYLTRAELDGLLSAPHHPPVNTDTLIDPALKADRIARGDAPAWRLRMEAVRPSVGDLYFHDIHLGEQPIDLTDIGDAIIARKDIGTSYHLAVVMDDAAQGVTVVTRGADLLPSTPLHRLLGVLLNLPETKWLHHPLVTDTAGRRLAKRDDALAIRHLRERGKTRNDILSLIKEQPLLKAETYKRN